MVLAIPVLYYKVQDTEITDADFYEVETLEMEKEMGDIPGGMQAPEKA